MISDNFVDAAGELEDALESYGEEMSTELRKLTEALIHTLEEIGRWGDIGYSYEEIDSEMVKDITYDLYKKMDPESSIQ